jgi:hypothetical protein
VVRSVHEVEPIGEPNRSRMRQKLRGIEAMVEPVRQWIGLAR